MNSQILRVFCLCDDLLKALRHPEDPPCEVSDAEVKTTAVWLPCTFGFDDKSKGLSKQLAHPLIQDIP
jgi:hypothetical protein